jgi:hypothetical protein
VLGIWKDQHRYLTELLYIAIWRNGEAEGLEEGRSLEREIPRLSGHDRFLA